MGNYRYLYCVEKFSFIITENFFYRVWFVETFTRAEDLKKNCVILRELFRIFGWSSSENRLNFENLVFGEELITIFGNFYQINANLPKITIIFMQCW